MAFSLNRIQIIGNLGNDCETRFTTNNVGVTNFNVATTHGIKGEDGNWKNETTWHNCVSFNLSDFYKDKLKKGSKVFVEGRLSKREYTDKEGVKKYFTEIIVEKLIPLDGRDSQPGGFNNSSTDSDSSSSSPNDDFTQNDNDDLPF